MDYKKLSIIIPVYNEKETLMHLLKRVENLILPGGLHKEIILVDDFSTDGTREILKEIKNHKIIFHEKNKGKGAAIRTALKHSSGDIILIQDADLEYNPEQLPELINPILEGRTKVVYGSRFLNKNLDYVGKNKTPLPHHLLGNKILTKATNLIYNTNLTDMETCYKVFSKDVLNKIQIKSNRFDFEPEITAKIAKNGEKILELPIEFKPRMPEEGKKIDWKDGIYALGVLIKYKFIN